MNENELKGLGCSLAYSLSLIFIRACGEGIGPIEELIISNFFHALTERGQIESDKVDFMNAYTLDRLSYYCQRAQRKRFRKRSHILVAPITFSVLEETN